MRVRPSFILTLATLLLAPPLAAQARPAPAAGAISAAANALPAASRWAHHRILTLAWTDITLPASLDRPATSPTAAHNGLARIFTLAWQERPALGSDGDRVALTAAPRCQTTVLVPVPCE